MWIPFEHISSIEIQAPKRLRDLLWTLSYLQSRADVIGEMLGCVGLSYGGRMTMLLAAVEPRVKVAVISGALNVMQERVTTYYGCGAQVIPASCAAATFPRSPR